MNITISREPNSKKATTFIGKLIERRNLSFDPVPDCTSAFDSDMETISESANSIPSLTSPAPEAAIPLSSAFDEPEEIVFTSVHSNEYNLQKAIKDILETGSSNGPCVSLSYDLPNGGMISYVTADHDYQNVYIETVKNSDGSVVKSGTICIGEKGNINMSHIRKNGSETLVKATSIGSSKFYSILKASDSSQYVYDFIENLIDEGKRTGSLQIFEASINVGSEK